MVEFTERLNIIKGKEASLAAAKDATEAEAVRIETEKTSTAFGETMQERKKRREAVEKFSDELKLEEKIAQIQDAFPQWRWTRQIPKPSGELNEDCADMVGFENDITNPTSGGSALIGEDHLRYDQKVEYRFTRERWFIALVYIPEGSIDEQPVLVVNNEKFTPQEANEKLLDDKLINAINSPLEIEVKSYIHSNQAGDYNG